MKEFLNNQKLDRRMKITLLK